MPGAMLCPLDTVLLGCDPQLVLVDPQHNFIPYLYAKGLAERCWDNDAAVFIHPYTGFHFHITLQFQ